MQSSLCLQDFTSKHEACCLAVHPKGASLASGLPPRLFVPSREEEASLEAEREILGNTDSLAAVIDRLVARA